MGRPRKPKLSVDAIADAAIELVDAHGSFTMADLASTLAVTPSSLYNHVSGRDDVIELIRHRMHEQMGVRVDPGAPWQDVVRAVARGQRDALARYPWLTSLLATSAAEPGAAVSSIENFATVLARAGFTDEEVLPIISAVDIAAIGGSLDLASPEDLYPQEVTEGSMDLARAVQAAPRGARRAEVNFSFTLDLIVEALEARLAARWQR
ncbi:TetR/AcrR family transcriptional regulator [Streptomyces melanosporofaciens]